MQKQVTHRALFYKIHTRYKSRNKNLIAHNRLPKSFMIIILMGVSGCGKTTVGAKLAANLGWIFQEGDALHPQKNIEKMSCGAPLSDIDRKPWLHSISQWIDSRCQSGTNGVISCSALKKSYRHVLTKNQNNIRLVYLQGTKELLLKRLAERTDHFMPPALLTSQLLTLEEPGADENTLVLTINQSPADIVSSIRDSLDLH